MLSSFSTLAVVGSSMLWHATEAHQVVNVPSPTWTRPNSTSKERRELWNPLSFLEKEGFKTQENFTQFQVDNGYKSLRDFMERAKYKVTDGADQACGWTDPKGIPQQIPADGTMRTTGYTHDGPCEIYMGEKLALSYLNCHESIPEQTFKLDYSGCGDSCVLYWYWLGVRKLKGKYSWQVYKECIPIYNPCCFKVPEYTSVHAEKARHPRLPSTPLLLTGLAQVTMNAIERSGLRENLPVGFGCLCGFDPSSSTRYPTEIPEDGTTRTSRYTHDDQTFKLDYSACGDSCVLYWNWFGVRYLKKKYSWQMYKECIPLYSSTGGGSITTTKAPSTEVSSAGFAVAPEADSTTRLNLEHHASEF
ncbi:hypothetical protein PC113_g6736 [Phytophthora cactorum]|uniref:Uncharacterized protein n=1 Tax=Phytophthora cactorum TaxID=29920 RepID=A0A8T0ZHZ9_9STRA|nr:hypothetical protein PC113_g6736 [Phytophthora cactorum]